MAAKSGSPASASAQLVFNRIQRSHRHLKHKSNSHKFSSASCVSPMLLPKSTFKFTSKCDFNRISSSRTSSPCTSGEFFQIAPPRFAYLFLIHSFCRYCNAYHFVDRSRYCNAHDFVDRSGFGWRHGVGSI